MDYYADDDDQIALLVVVYFDGVCRWIRLQKCFRESSIKKKKKVLVVVPNVENKMKICIFTSSLISFQKTRVLLL